MGARIVVVGSFNTDLTAYTERLPRPGETVSGRRFVTGPGGKGSNQAVAAARLGAEVTFVGRIGQDVFAQLALDTWTREGIDTRYVVADPEHATGVAPILVDDAGENSIVVVLGANLAVARADVDAARDAIAAADIVLTQLEIDPDTTTYALEVARQCGVRTILNPAPATPLSARVIALADMLTPNETELEVIAGRVGVSVEEAARSVLARDDQVVVATLGGRGACYVQRDRSATIAGFDVEVVDTTGAGDAFNGGLAVAVAEGRQLDAAIRFANAVAALSVTRPGTAPSMPQREAVDALLAGHAVADG